MSKEEIIFKLDGTQNTITSYTKDPYIISYDESFKSTFLNQETTLNKLLLSKLCDWYNTNIQIIEQDKFLYNIDTHYKTITLLTDIKETYY